MRGGICRVEVNVTEMTEKLKFGELGELRLNSGHFRTFP